MKLKNQFNIITSDINYIMIELNKQKEKLNAKDSDVSLHCAKDRTEYYISNPKRAGKFWENIVWKGKLLQLNQN